MTTASIPRCRPATWRRCGNRGPPERRRGRCRSAGSVDRLPQVDQPIAVTVGQRLEQHAADDAEDRRVGADAERQRDHDHGGERGAVSQRAQGVPDVGGNAFDPWQSALRADCFGGHGETSGRQQRLPARRVRMHATPDVLGGLHLEMRLQLLAEIVVRAVSGEDVQRCARARREGVSWCLPSRREKGGDQIGGPDAIRGLRARVACAPRR